LPTTTPRFALALVLERAGRMDEAQGSYAATLEVWTQDPPALERLVRVTLLAGDRDDPRLEG